MKWLLGLLCAAFLGLASFQVVMRLAALELSRRVSSEQALSQAIEFDDRNPEFYHQRADLLLNNLRIQSYHQAGEDLSEATRLNPHYWRYWADLARFHERVGDTQAAESSYRKAVALSPINGLYHWALFNFLLRRGRTEEALVELEASLRLDQELWEPGLDMLIGLSVDSQRLLDIWPANRPSTLFLMQRLTTRPNPDMTRDLLLKQLFDRMLEFEPGKMEEFNRLVFYWRARHPEEARSVWTRSQKKLGIAAPEFESGQNLVWNGGFEQPQQAGVFGWRFQSGGFLLVDQIAGLGYLSSTALRVRIDGRVRKPSTLLATQHPVTPPGSYILSCRYRSDDNKSDGKLELALLQMSGGPTTVLELEARDHAQWSKVEAYATVATGEDLRLQLGSGLSRTGTALTLWLDDVRLTPVKKLQ